MEKSCSTCKYGRTSYPNARCSDCIDLDHPGCKIEWHRLWEPSEKAVKAYIEKINEGSNGMIQSDYNVISKPKHYMLFDEMEVKGRGIRAEGIEVRDVIEKLVDKCYSDGLATQGSSLFISDYVQLMQYLMRFMDKNGKEDLEKARVYLNWMIEAYE